MGKAIQIIKGEKIALLATGASVGESKKAAEKLIKKMILIVHFITFILLSR